MNRVILDIAPRRIDPVAWAEVYDDALKLLLAHPARLLGCGRTNIAGVELPVYTRAIERDRDDERGRRWSVAGERATLATGECQTMFRDVGRYLGPTPPEGPAPVPDDILFAVPVAGPEPFGRPLPAYPVPAHLWALPCSPPIAPPPPGIARVLGGVPAPAPCALPLLAAAMLVEAHFPRYAMVHGDIDRAQAEAVRRWAEGVLGRPVALPVRMDAWRLAERLGTRLEGRALVTAAERFYLAPPETKPATLLGIFSRDEAEAWFLGKLREHGHPSSAAALRLLAAHLETRRDLRRLCALACADACGPAWAPASLVEALAALRARREPRADLLDDASVARELAAAFGADADRLVELFRRHAAEPPAPALPRVKAAGWNLTAEIEALATLPSPGDLAPVQRASIDAVIHSLNPAEGATGLRTIATLLATNGPTLTEDAWDWIGREQDPELLRFLTALAALDDAGAELGHVRRALFENGGLCRYALRVLRVGASGL